MQMQPAVPWHPPIAVWPWCASVQAYIILPCFGGWGLTVADHALKVVVQDGHQWWLCRDSVGLPEQVGNSLWRNMDRTATQVTHAMDSMQRIRATAQTLTNTKHLITQGDRAAAAHMRNPATPSDLTLLHPCNFYVQFLENGAVHMVSELVDVHRRNRNI